MADLVLVRFLEDATFPLDPTPFLKDEEFLLEAESAIGLIEPNPEFREEIAYALAWAVNVGYRFPDQPPTVLREILRHVFAAANSLNLTADAMDTIPGKCFERFEINYTEQVRELATWTKNFGKDFVQPILDFIVNSDKEIGARSEKGGSRAMVGFTGLVTRLAGAYIRQHGTFPGVTLRHKPVKHFAGPFIRLIEAAVSAIRRFEAKEEDAFEPLVAPEPSSYAGGRRVERILNAIESGPIVAPRNTEERHLQSLQNLLFRLGFVDYPD